MAGATLFAAPVTDEERRQLAEAASNAAPRAWRAWVSARRRAPTSARTGSVGAAGMHRHATDRYVKG